MASWNEIHTKRAWGRWPAEELVRWACRIPEPCRAKMRVLEIGCGAGANLRMLAEEGFGEIWGLDVSPAAIQRVHDAHGSRFNLVCQHAEDFLRETKREWDLIVDVCALQHIGDTELPEVIRSRLAKGGRAFSIWVQRGCDLSPIVAHGIPVFSADAGEIASMFQHYSTVHVGWSRRAVSPHTWLGHWVVEAEK